MHVVRHKILSTSTARRRGGVSSIMQAETAGGVLTSAGGTWAHIVMIVLNYDGYTIAHYHVIFPSRSLQITLSLCMWGDSRESTKLHLQHGCHFQSVSTLN